MKVIYIAGRYRASCEWELETFLRKAEDAAIKLWSEGWAVICPHKNTAHFGGANGIEDQVWLNGDLEILKRCDAIYMLDNWRESSGAKIEREHAIFNNLDIYYEDMKDHAVDWRADNKGCAS